MGQTVTQEMRDAMHSSVEKAIERLGYTDWGQFELTDSLILLMHDEKIHHENGEPNTGIGEFVALLNESCEEEIIREYVVLKEHFHAFDNMSTKVALLRGLHRYERNREWMDPADSDSVQRNTVLLNAIVLLRRIGYEWLVNEALDYRYSWGNRHRDHGFKDPECADLILDRPDHYDTLINTMFERGYREGIDVFREMVTNDAPALNGGVL